MFRSFNGRHKQLSDVPLRVLSVFGTRPEAVKMAPVVKLLSTSKRFESKVCVTAQHREMLDSVLKMFAIQPEYDLNIMDCCDSLADISSLVIEGVTKVLYQWKPDWVLVHGDTSTSFAAALAAFYQHVPVAHVEAGLRSRNIFSPWPEEANRKLTAVITALHFAPTQTAKENLLRENIAESHIVVTGNTVIDTLVDMTHRIEQDPCLQHSLQQRLPALPKGKRLIVVTGHRRENFGRGMQMLVETIRCIVQRGDVEVWFPVHLNPNVHQVVHQALANLDAVRLLSPLDYDVFVYLMMQATIILTDSGGIQEEAPSLGKPVLLLRDTTERPEAIAAGTVLKVGMNTSHIMKQIHALLDDEDYYAQVANLKNPYGDGKAAKRITDALLQSNGGVSIH